MGGRSWNPDDWKAYSRATSAKTAAAIFTRSGIDADLDPLGITMRESRDSTGHPESHGLIFGIDVTGSMGQLAEVLVKKGIGIVVEELLKRKPIADPQIMVMGIGDVEADTVPLQVSQFESDLLIAQQTEKIFIEHGGGSNSYESYTFPWYFAARHTSIDCFEKRGKKGYLFTVGDEEVPPVLTREAIKQFTGDIVQSDMTAAELLAAVERSYHVYHVIIEEGNYCRNNRDRTFNSWREILGQRALPLSDHTKLAEVIVSMIEVNEGQDKAKVVDSWDGSTSLVVKRAIESVSVPAKARKGIVRFA